MSEDGHAEATASRLDETFVALADPSRRYLVRHLDRNGPTTLSTLSDHLAAERNETTTVAVTPAQRRTAAIRLHHVHLPKLEAAALVAPLDEDDLVEPTDRLSYVLATLPTDCDTGEFPSPGESAVLD
ncbi:DUF7344 domain-containing protein [Halomarina oriensis]|uniref:DUF7344 domain-containing protein n=1 Tax=Halomarina oriensis TaxID=671145 RepID=A0A6B0GDR3_9EURY|nr:hypothetical protein [Halomarina oriensis]MWG33066.1 hypothetical protein [Halomarina oriensis]